MLIDLSQRLTNNKPKIRIDAEHEYEVRNNKNVAILIDEISKSKEIADFAKEGDKTDKVIEAALGKEALDYLKTLDLAVSGWNLIVEGIMAAINEVTLDEIEKETKKAHGDKVKDFRK